MKFYIYIAHKKLPHKTLRVHSTRYTQRIHVSSHKLKLPKDTHTKKYKQLLPTHPFPKVELYIAVNCKNIYRCTVLLFTERSLYCASCEATLTKASAVQSCEVGYDQRVSLLGMTCIAYLCCCNALCCVNCCTAT